MADAGDVKGDGVDDLLVDAVNGSDLYVVFGQPNALRSVLTATGSTGAQG